VMVTRFSRFAAGAGGADRWRAPGTTMEFVTAGGAPPGKGRWFALSSLAADAAALLVTAMPAPARVADRRWRRAR